MKYKEALKNSFKKVDDLNMIPLSFPHFLMSMSVVLNGVTASILSESKDENEIRKCSIEKVNSVYMLDDFINSIRIGDQLYHFVEWLLDQELEESDDDTWYGVNILVKKWNEYASGVNKNECI